MKKTLVRTVDTDGAKVIHGLRTASCGRGVAEAVILGGGLLAIAQQSRAPAATRRMD